ncbi:septal ring lytic transglycosylase RlpA family protein [Marichromatium bheemlicum]|uniref:Endolytic peptidoglycan transglycosylase RlpA n=1 Tax=Marichromatium bheemlicum TaxID=365339 RepID=A0ABX1I6E0_9GAMM|nr:septal ring lytic transglycosylase RlpA family protein [Marichromatium bheemlicum]NKN32306.1 septal ring lytic transglycosylase RlpA family protein [Marichromatium bheemlicum]
MNTRWFGVLAVLPLLCVAALAEANVSEGVASYYAERFNGRLTASGVRFDMHALTAAHRTLPFGTRVQVRNKDNGRAVVVTINDRGPYVAGRSIDLSKGAAKALGMLHTGLARVELRVLEVDESLTPAGQTVAEAQAVMRALF